MPRYDSEGYRQLPGIDRSPRRQILGYSRQAQGGVAAARERAARKVYDAQDHLYEGEGAFGRREARNRRVAEAKVEGTFDDTREAYNEEAAATGSQSRMDQAGGIRSYVKQATKYTEPTKKKAVASETPRIFRPASERIADIVAMTEPAGLLNMAQKARRRGTLVVK